MHGKLVTKVEHKMQIFSNGHRLDFKNDCYIQSKGPITVLEHIKYIKDLGVTFNSKLKFVYHINEKVDKSHSVLGLIYRHVKYICCLILSCVISKNSNGIRQLRMVSLQTNEYRKNRKEYR